ncbi:MAG: hypothetical protein HC852_16810 [Acaryochloridaceae cyanobacterium RU_4_10]|nr:hypothetical protein [Acaryochloridaceae cyanobacterium RU_4_10]
MDHGDAPNTYSTLLANNGARHTRDGKLFLGAGVTGEANGQPSSSATADANDDGITFSPSLGQNYSNLIQAGVANTVTVDSSGSGYLNAWVDYNQDGDFNDSGEQILTNTPVSAGNNSLNFSALPPNTILHGPTFARFRLSSGSISTPSPTDSVSSGEVEDYQVNVGNPIPNGTACTTTGLIDGEFNEPSLGSATPSLSIFVGGDIKIYDETLVPGWNTTALDPTYTGTTNTGGIEIWKSGVNAGNGVTPAYNNTGQFAEINAYQAAALFQDIVTVPGATLTWQFAHRARVGVDTLNVRAGSPNLTLVQRS